MKFRPLHDRVVVKRLDGEEKTARNYNSRQCTRKTNAKEKLLQ